MDKELEELVGKLIKLDDWQKEYGHFKIGSCEGEFVTRKGEAKFRVYFLKESVCPTLAIDSFRDSHEFSGAPTSKLYSSLIEKYGPLNWKAEQAEKDAQFLRDIIRKL